MKSYDTDYGDVSPVIGRFIEVLQEFMEEDKEVLQGYETRFKGTFGDGKEMLRAHILGNWIAKDLSPVVLESHGFHSEAVKLRDIKDAAEHGANFAIFDLAGEIYETIASYEDEKLEDLNFFVARVPSTLMFLNIGDVGDEAISSHQTANTVRFAVGVLDYEKVRDMTLRVLDKLEAL